ncbi:ABC transporter ATP-binding protein [Halanaerobium praevalens]|uniref:ABC transporter related protein n=1 Tax=Halanaerobium praevalens (strain ATCC 33744 / DSM 2228 / GSL) TaxID=572479 RepID=E3DME4_HALPG|nr:ATP-binding cassette domain-containing protein [Halanaerobium praevalens]ADO76337.1 ABC transporter related protein [Halanaerobium praevalens DSM 2228]
MIEIKNLTKKYGDKAVVKNVNLKIKKGKITSFIGPNGAGKSTLLSLISRIIKHYQGDIYLEGKLINDYQTTEFARKLSILKQSNNLNLMLTVRELIEFGRFPYSKGNLNELDHQKVEQALAYMQLNNLENRYLNQLSGGQRQRAFIAMIIAQDTEYILLDEPLNNLDVKHSVEIMKRLRRLVDELDKTVIIVMHDINFASCYSDQIVALNEGLVVKKGGVEEIINEKILESIYETDFNIKDIDQKKICLYY